jgi:GTP-binding protein
MFIDQAKIFVRGGRGGDGCHSFYRDKYSRRGVPDGGDGGKGADIIICADNSLSTLLDFKYKRHFYGLNGAHGSGKNKKGRNAQRLVIRVPPGTLVKDARSGCLLRDLKEDQEEVIVASGGKGGVGNRGVQEATSGSEGEEKELLLDLKLLAEVGVVGFPNVGKSTLIAAVSNAHPKIAPYPFTTTSPVLGVVRYRQKHFVIADIPGLIEGSSRGRGLGDRFLRHIERSRVLVHMVDISGFEGRDPLEDYQTLNQELGSYNRGLLRRTQIIAANKMDLEGSDVNLVKFRQRIKKKIFPISALKKQGLEDLIEAIAERL